MKKLIVVLMLVMIGFVLNSFTIDTIDVVGNKRVESEDIKNAIIGENDTRKTIAIMFGEVFGKHKDIPNIAKYKLNILSPSRLQIVVEENPIIGCIFYMSSFMYFDRTGMVSYSKTYSEQGIPIVEGISFRNVVIGQKLEVRNKNEFNKLANIARAMQNADLHVDNITFKGESDITLRLGRIYVLLGDARNIEIQANIIAEVYPQLQGKAGTLDLSAARENMINESYIFKKDSGR